jgi:hypothetical protein
VVRGNAVMAVALSRKDVLNRSMMSAVQRSPAIEVEAHGPLYHHQMPFGLDAPILAS